MPQINISDELFEQLTQYCNQSDNGPDDALRGELLGFGGRRVLVAPGAIIRVPDKSAIGSRIFIGLYSYINGPVTIDVAASYLQNHADAKYFLDTPAAAEL